jgi:hypothetical protein
LKKPDAKIYLTMQSNGIFCMEIHDPRGKRVIFSDPNDVYKAPYADMEKAVGETIRIILESKAAAERH